MPDMPKMTKPPAALVERFDALLASRPDVQRRLTFGAPCGYVGGNMVTGLHQDTWFVRLGPAEATALMAIEGSRPFAPMPGRAMTGYTVLPDAVVADQGDLRAWVDRAIDFGQTLPPKVPKARRGATPAR